MLKTINVNVLLHKELKLYGIKHGLSIAQVIEKAFKNLSEIQDIPTPDVPKKVENHFKKIEPQDLGVSPVMKKEPALESECIHGYKRSYCIHKKCEFYASWR